MSKFLRFATGPLLATMALPFSAAHAQDSSQGVAPAEVQGADDIVVTAQKRPELLSKTPLSISAVTGASLRASGVVDATSLQIAVPTIRIEQTVGLRITIRGVSSADVTEKGDPSAAFMLNGVYLARSQSLSGAFYDIDRIEVLRGPQGTLYGRNATAGVVNVLTKRPTDKFEGAINTEFANYDTQRIDGMLNLPFSDKFAIRAAGAYNKRDSYLVSRPGAKVGLGSDQDEYSGRLSAELKFGPGNSGNIFIVGDYGHQGGGGAQPVNIGNYFQNPTSTSPIFYGASSAERRTVTYDLLQSPKQDVKNYGVSGELSYDFGGVGITYLGSYRVFDRYYREQLTFPNSESYPDNYLSGKTFSNSQELRLATTGTGPLSAVAGLYYFREKTKDQRTVLANYAGYALYAFIQDPTIGESKAAFGQATYAIADRLRLTGGLRYSKDDKSRVGRTIIQRTSSVLDPSQYVVLAVNDAKRDFSKLTWKAGADFDLTRRVLLYANIATGYKAGGFNDGCRASAPNCGTPVAEDRLYYEPEELTSYEVGMKGRFLGDTLTLNLTGFWYDYSDLQLSTQQVAPAPPGQVTLNAGKARVKGIESQAIITPTSRDRFDISFNYLDAYYTRYRPTLAIDFAGRTLDNSPKFTVQAGYSHTFPLGNDGNVVVHGDTQFNSAYVNTNFSSSVQFENPAYTRSNATITYNAPGNRWYLQGFLKNAENKIIFSGYSGGRIYTSEPRVYGARAGVRF